MNDVAEQVEVEMPRYVSHKKVWALELRSADLTANDEGILTFTENGYAPLKVPGVMFVRYKPVPGDFFVQYEDGYKSFSPRKAFIEGYKRET